MTAALADLMTEMATILETAFAATDVDVQVTRGRNFNPSGVSVDIYRADPFRRTDAAGMGDISGELIFTVRARVDVADYDANQDILLAMVDDEDPMCVAAALEEDQTLNGLASSVNVDGPTGDRFYSDVGEAPRPGTEWAVTVLRAFS